MNNATFIGNLTRDAIQKTSSNNKPYTTFDIAINDKRGQKESVMYVSCIMGGDTSKLLPYLTKGTKVCVQGRVSCHAYTNKQGQAIANLDLLVNQLELLGGNKDKTAAQPQQPDSGFAPSSAPNQPNVTDEEDLPF